MILRTISNTKKFFQKTVESFKSFLSGGYERLPKNSPCSSFPCGGGSTRHQVKYTHSYREMLNECYHPDSSIQRDVVGAHPEQTNKARSKVDTHPEHTNKARGKKKDSSTAVVSRNESRVRDSLMNYANHAGGPGNNFFQVDRKENPKKKKILYQGKRCPDFSSTRGLKGGRSFLVEKRLKELEMLDKSNVEHVLDIEEVLHYYSRLTCPAYVDIVDSFFMDMYAELLNGQQASSRQSINSRTKLQRIGFNA